MHDFYDSIIVFIGFPATNLYFRLYFREVNLEMRHSNVWSRQLPDLEGEKAFRLKNTVPMVDIIFYLWRPVGSGPHPSMILPLCFCYIVLDFYHKEAPNHPKKQRGDIGKKNRSRTKHFTLYT